MGQAIITRKGGESGGIILNPLSNPATADEITSGYEAYNDQGELLLGTNTGSETSELDGLVDGSLTSFTMPSEKTTIAPYRFYNFSNLTDVDLGEATTVGNYAFNECSNLINITATNTLTIVGGYAFYNCKKVQDFTLPSSLTSVGAYAFYYLGGSTTNNFEFVSNDTCSIGTYAFRYSRLSKLSGSFSTIDQYAIANITPLTEVEINECSKLGNYAVANNSYLTKLHAKINGSIGTGAFYRLPILSDVNIDKESVITSLDIYAFSGFGGNRSTPETNIITLDFRNSTFTSIPQYGFGDSASSLSYRNQYMKIFFPNTVSTISSYAFGYVDNVDVYFSNETPPSLSATTVFSNATNYNIFVPYNSANAYRIATNWAAQSANIYGWASENTFEVGDTLPTMNDEKYGLTWYSDSALTTPVTEVTDANAIYYCSVGEEQLAYDIVSITTIDCEIVVSDGTTTYQQGDIVATGTVLTITATPSVDGYVPYIFTVNGEDFESGNTITVGADIKITALYYDGENVPYSPTFSENTWDMIRQAFTAGIASNFWSVGDTKSITLSDNTEITIRIADMTSSRYDYADGSGSSNGVFEFVECYPTVYYMNSSNTNSGGWANCYMKNTVMDTIYNQLPSDLQAVISEVNVLSGTGSGSTSGTSSSANKLFLPSEYEIFGTKSYSIGSSEGSPQYGYYSANNTASARIKYRSGSAIYWWLRSPRSGYSGRFCGVANAGSASGSVASGSGGVAPCFAI